MLQIPSHITQLTPDLADANLNVAPHFDLANLAL